MGWGFFGVGVDGVRALGIYGMDRVGCNGMG